MEKANPLPNADLEGPFSSEDGSLQLDYAAEQKLVRKLDVWLSHQLRGQSADTKCSFTSCRNHTPVCIPDIY